MKKEELGYKNLSQYKVDVFLYLIQWWYGYPPAKYFGESHRSIKNLLRIKGAKANLTVTGRHMSITIEI